MLTMMIREQIPQLSDAQCFSFACPGCMTLELAQSCSSYVTTLIYGIHRSSSFSNSVLQAQM